MGTRGDEDEAEWRNSKMILTENGFPLFTAIQRQRDVFSRSINRMWCRKTLGENVWRRTSLVTWTISSISSISLASDDGSHDSIDWKFHMSWADERNIGSVEPSSILQVNCEQLIGGAIIHVNYIPPSAYAISSLCESFSEEHETNNRIRTHEIYRLTWREPVHWVVTSLSAVNSEQSSNNHKQ